MMIYLESLGCCRNQVDSEVMLGRLQQRGHGITPDPSRAEVIIVNTCGFIASASAQAIDAILEMAGHKKTGACRRLIVTGCLPERFKSDDIAAELPEVDAFLGIGACDDIVRAVEDTSGPVMTLLPDPALRSFQGHPHPRILTTGHLAYVKVSEGCDRHCTYCIIPQLRGVQRSRPVKDILTEVNALLAAGVKEIVLVAESTTDYGTDLCPPVSLSVLLESVSRSVKSAGYSPDTAWIRLLYTHPSSMNQQIIHSISSLDMICSYFDVPIQHASTKVLKRMGRHYSTQDLYTLFEAIRSSAPDAALRTTIITGFPGETPKDFKELLAFVEAVRFNHLGVFPYSDSEDLKSHPLSGHVSEKTAKKRHDILMETQAGISAEINRTHLGRTLRVLVEEKPDDGLYLGRTRFQAPEVDGMTFIYGSGLEIGSFVDVKITETFEYDLAGDVVNEAGPEKPDSLSGKPGPSCH
ncbi:MAG: 30S ribosomal protein S12 methylthiotransferase RimO [Pseudomonadota bacterium]